MLIVTWFVCCQMSTFDELMKQVASLQAENCSLKRELQNNAGNISKLESEAHSMKDVLSHLQHAIQVRCRRLQHVVRPCCQ